MNPPTLDAAPGLMRRIAIAFGAFFGAIGDAEFAARVAALRDAPASAAPPAPAPAPLKETSPDAALQLLGILQREARLVDFALEDIAHHADADIGAAARLVHEGCRKVLHEHFRIEPVLDRGEGSAITVEAGFDAAAIRLTGHVVGAPPFHGSVGHRGWRAAEVRLPKLAERHDARIVAPAEVEL